MRIILVNFSSSYHRTIARELIRKGVKVSAIFYLSRYRDPPTVEKNPTLDARYEADVEFKDTKLLDIKEWQYADRVVEWIGKSRTALSGQFLKEMSDCEKAFMRNSDRFSFYPQSASRLRRIYYGLLCGLLDLLDETHPDLIFFADSPHVGFDTVLYYLAKKRSIKTSIIEGTHLNNTSIIIHDYMHSTKVPLDFLRSVSIEKLKMKVNDIVPLKSLFSPKSLQYIHERHKKAVGGSWIGKAGRNLQHGIKNLIGLFMLTEVEGYSRALVYNSKRTFRDKSIARIRYNQRARRAKYLLGKYISKQIDLSILYVFFPLHMQPEKTTSAFGGDFEDQYLALKIISKSIPDDWKIYVKEHPVQYQLNSIERNNYRDEQYYKMLKSIHKVEMVPFNFPYDELMRSAQVCSTITGSVGWESLLSGRPAIIFGNNWYSPCRACFKVSSLEECQVAIESAAKMGSDEVHAELMRFILFRAKDYIQIAANPTRLGLFDKNIEEQVSLYSDIIIEEARK